MMYILSFFETKISAYCFSFMIYIENLYFIYRRNLSKNMKQSLKNVRYVVKLCVQMNQRVTRHLTFRVFLTEKRIIIYYNKL